MHGDCLCLVWCVLPDPQRWNHARTMLEGHRHRVHSRKQQTVDAVPQVVEQTPCFLYVLSSACPFFSITRWCRSVYPGMFMKHPSQTCLLFDWYANLIES